MEWTLAQEPQWVNDELIPAHFEALELTNDPRWQHKKFIATPPHFRYFCGVPLRTENDINIGVLFLMDTEVPAIREAISVPHIKLLTSIAKNIMIVGSPLNASRRWYMRLIVDLLFSISKRSETHMTSAAPSTCT